MLNVLNLLNEVEKNYYFIVKRVKDYAMCNSCNVNVPIGIGTFDVFLKVKEEGIKDVVEKVGFVLKDLLQKIIISKDYQGDFM